jgi:hypothetical protein
MDVTPGGSILCLNGDAALDPALEPGLLIVPEEDIVLRAFAAPVLAVSIIFLKNPLFLGVGVANPPSSPGDWIVLGVSGCTAEA